MKRISYYVLVEISYVTFGFFSEQERIVTKLEKLMKFCDELKANTRQGITCADQLLHTALKEALEPRNQHLENMIFSKTTA